jgi:hypothetical protein
MSLQAGKRMFMREIEVKGPRGGSIRRSGVGRGRWKKNAFRPGSEIGRAKSRRYVLANTTPWHGSADWESAYPYHISP